MLALERQAADRPSVWGAVRVVVDTDGTAADRPSRFIRVMILPRALIGKSSIQYVNEADKEKPRVQQYKIFADAAIERP